LDDEPSLFHQPVEAATVLETTTVFEARHPAGRHQTARRGFRWPR
jgi:hypothetical protein